MSDLYDKNHIWQRNRLEIRLLTDHSDTVSDSDLLEYAIYLAHPYSDARDLARRLLKRFGSYGGVLVASNRELAELEGVSNVMIGLFRLTQLGVQRILREDLKDRNVIASTEELLRYCRSTMAFCDVEQLRVLFLDHTHKLIADEVRSRGTVNHAPLYPREIIKRSLDLGASGIVLVHNHPSGDVTPSRSDFDMTIEMIEAGKGLGISVHDHLIFSRRGHQSIRDLGVIDFERK